MSRDLTRQEAEEYEMRTGRDLFDDMQADSEEQQRGENGDQMDEDEAATDLEERLEIAMREPAP